jgi:hypothetical protein
MWNKMAALMEDTLEAEGRLKSKRSKRVDLKRLREFDKVTNEVVACEERPTD